MRKQTKAILLASAICASLLGATACNDSAPVYETKLMNGFEVFDRDVQIIRMFNEFGVLDQNANKDYVRSGDYSLKLTPLGSRVNSANPFILLPTYSLRFEEIKFADFTSVDSISFWFYSAEQTPVNVGVGFGTGALTVSSEDRRDVIRKTNVEYFSLSQGWNYIEYDVQPSYLTLQDLKIDEVYGVVLEFDYVQSHLLADSPEVYLDDVTLTYTDTPKSSEFSMDVKSGQTKEGNPYWQISDFENPLEAYYYFYHYKYPAPASAHPVIKTVFAAEYDVLTTSGTQALLVQKKHGGTNYGWPTVRIHENVMKAVFAAIGQDILDNPQNYAFKFDLYNASNVAGGWSVEFDGAQTWDNISVQPGEWGTYSCTFQKINNAVQVDNLPYTQSIGGVRFSWSRYPNDEDTADRPFLLDNVRIEKIA